MVRMSFLSRGSVRVRTRHHSSRIAEPSFIRFSTFARCLETAGIQWAFFDMARKIDIPDFDPDLSSLDGLVRSMNYAAPYLTDFYIGDITLGRLRRLAVSKVRDSYYHSFEIPKKSGGTRTITAPGGELKKVQTVLAYILDYIYLVPSPVMGFVSERSVATNAAQHVGRSYVLNIDLKDFFPSVKRHMIAGVLKKYGVDRDVANLILRLCCRTPEGGGEDCLPQGAPTSPLLSNIACTCLDIRLSGLAQSTGLTYTRYADDITFSSDHNVYREDGPFWSKLRSIIAECGFTINENKTRLLRPWNRQEVTGITVNSKVNVSKKYLKNLRAELHRMKYTDFTREDFLRAVGKVHYVRMVRRGDSTTGYDYRNSRLADNIGALRYKLAIGVFPEPLLPPVESIDNSDSNIIFHW